MRQESILFLFPGEPIVINQEHRREISGFISNHRPIPSQTNQVPVRKSSNIEQQLISVAQRLSLHKQNEENVETIHLIKK